MSKSNLTDKQAMFCKEYLIDLNATQAAIRAGYSEDSSYSIGSENMSKPELQAEVQRLMAKRSKKVEITADYVLGNIKSIGEHCMDKKNYRESGALKAQELMGKHIKLFGDVNRM